MKVSIATAHTPKGTFGSGADGYINESDASRQVVPLVVEKLIKNGIEAKEFVVNKANTYKYEDCNIRAAQANSWGADLYVEIHFNDFNDFQANGTEVLVSGNNSKALPYAKRINDNICSALGTFDRTYGKGYKTQNLIVLNKTNMAALLVECLFVSNKADTDKYNAELISTAIAEGILNKKIEEKVEFRMDNLVCYCNEVDKRAAEYLADYLKCPCMDANRPFHYSGVAKNLIAVGGGEKFSSYTTVAIKGNDRYDTVKEVLKYIGKL